MVALIRKLGAPGPRVVVSLCDVSGNMVQPWVQAGYSAVLVDPKHPAETHANGVVSLPAVVADVFGVLAPLAGRVALLTAFPPCTHLAVSGARWWGAKREADPAFQTKALNVVMQCVAVAAMLRCPWMVENPVGALSSMWRKPDATFHPCDFTAWEPADNYTKRTCIWHGGGFIMPESRQQSGLGPPDSRIHMAPPGDDRAAFRSVTPMGFARAVFDANAYPTQSSLW